jgi:hypothetical protein
MSDKIKPDVKEAVKPELQEQRNTFTPHEGEVHVVRVDPAGNYIPGSDFSVSERTYNRTYKNRNEFQLKKSPTKPTK